MEDSKLEIIIIITKVVLQDLNAKYLLRYKWLFTKQLQSRLGIRNRLRGKTNQNK
jgi:hypothetical protein